LKHLRIPFEDIKEATQNFTTLIGRGGYGPVYRGQLSLSGEHMVVAVKRLQSDHRSGQGLKEFLTEIQLLSRYKHPNIEEAPELLELEGALEVRKLVETLQIQQFEEACEVQELEEALGLHKLVETLQLQQFTEACEMNELEEALGLRKLVETLQQHEFEETLKLQEEARKFQASYDYKLVGDLESEIGASRIDYEVLKAIYDMPDTPLSYIASDQIYSHLSRGILVDNGN
ncbi:hypothetical protein M8C21_016660, partial [Ambrosia artemisiifolia]